MSEATVMLIRGGPKSDRPLYQIINISHYNMPMKSELRLTLGRKRGTRIL